MQRIGRVRMPEGVMMIGRLPEREDAVKIGDFCLCELDYGQDVGRLVDVTTCPDSEMPAFRVLHVQTPQEVVQVQANAELAEKAKQAFRLSVKSEKTPVKVFHVCFSFHRERLFIRYGAVIPVDLRRFVNQIQRDYKTQVDLWQVPVRDEASFIGCLGICGRAACCCTWQRQFPGMNVRMAKAQDIPLNPVTSNGTCGCLKCCLAFEYGQYCEAGEHLPVSGAWVCCRKEVQDSEGMVVGRDVMRGRLTVRTREGRFVNALAEDVEILQAAHPEESTKENEHEDAAGQWSEP